MEDPMKNPELKTLIIRSVDSSTSGSLSWNTIRDNTETWTAEEATSTNPNITPA